MRMGKFTLAGAAPVRAHGRLRIMRWLRYMVLAAVPAALLGFELRTPADTEAARRITIATWNLEWMVSQTTAHASRLACQQLQRAPLPCEVARELARDSADLARLAAYARALNADVVAFQEVEDAAIAQRIFNGYDICIALGPGLQHVGFAIRPEIPHRCGTPVDALTLGDRHRAGATLWLAPGTAQQIEMLAVHLKSGCAHGDLDSGVAACVVLAGQAQVLGQWIAQRTAAHARFILLGDFNRTEPDNADGFWRQLAGGSDLHMSFADAANNTPFRNCYIAQGFTHYIDHILLGSSLSSQIVPGSFARLGYSPRDALRYRLSDHCPIRVSLIWARI
jgi:endonuclease/exonuclease/phosphatase family metal-dependent hydrolase